jgi:hypothetical protein
MEFDFDAVLGWFSTLLKWQFNAQTFANN